MPYRDKDFIEGINIIKDYIPKETDFNFAAEHDIIYFGEYDWVIDKKKKAKLKRLGWLKDEDSWTFIV